MTTDIVAGVDVATPPVTRNSAVNLAQAYAAHPLQIVVYIILKFKWILKKL